MIEIAAIVACAILAGLAVFQSALIAGAPLGRFAWGGNHTTLPNKLRVASVSSIILYVIFSVLILSKAGLINIPIADSFINVGMWVLAGYFSLGIVMNAVSRSKPERLLMTPVVTVLAALFLYVAMQ